MTIRHFLTHAISSIGLCATFGTVAAQPTYDVYSPHFKAMACVVSLELAKIALAQGVLGDVKQPTASMKYNELSWLSSKHRKTLEESKPTEPNFQQSWSAVTSMIDQKTVRGQNGRITLKGSLGNPVDFYKSESAFIDLRCR